MPCCGQNHAYILLAISHLASFRGGANLVCYFDLECPQLCIPLQCGRPPPARNAGTGNNESHRIRSGDEMWLVIYTIYTIIYTTPLQQRGCRANWNYTAFCGGRVMNTQYFYTKSIIRRCVKYFFNNYKIFLALKYDYCTLLTRVTKSDLDELSIIPSFLPSLSYITTIGWKIG